MKYLICTCLVIFAIGISALADNEKKIKNFKVSNKSKWFVLMLTEKNCEIFTRNTTKPMILLKTVNEENWKWKSAIKNMMLAKYFGPRMQGKSVM